MLSVCMMLDFIYDLNHRRSTFMNISKPISGGPWIEPRHLLKGWLDYTEVRASSNWLVFFAALRALTIHVLVLLPLWNSLRVDPFTPVFM